VVTCVCVCAGSPTQAAVDALRMQLALLGGGGSPPTIQRDFKYLNSMERRQCEEEAAIKGGQAGVVGEESKDGNGGDKGGGSIGEGGGGEGADGLTDSQSVGGRGSSTGGQGDRNDLLPMLEDMLAGKASKVGSATCC